MIASSQAMLARLTELYMADRCAPIAESCAFPFAMHVAEDLFVFRSPEEFASVVSAHRALMHSAGMTDLWPRITAIELPRGGRFRLWIDFDHSVQGQRLIAASQSVLYCRTTEVTRDAARPEGLMIEMADFSLLWEGSQPRPQPKTARPYRQL